jgi:serine/threonine-protein phosphatase 5
MPKDFIMKVLDDAIAVYRKLPNVVKIPLAQGKEIRIHGDTHGQFDDFAKVFAGNIVDGIEGDVERFPSDDCMFLFNGDMVDRGPKSFEIVMSLLLFTLANPHSTYILRGNHETRHCTTIYGFREEILSKYDEEVYEKFIELFETLPIAAVIEDEVFVAHGGIAHEDLVNMTIASIDSEVNRFVADVGRRDVLSSLLWSDPKEAGLTGVRMGGRPQFGRKATASFLKTNNLSLLVRSHEMRQDGFTWEHEGRAVTIFSAPNYCGVCGNKGAVLHLRRRDGEGSNDEDDDSRRNIGEVGSANGGEDFRVGKLIGHINSYEAYKTPFEDSS